MSEPTRLAHARRYYPALNRAGFGLSMAAYLMWYVAVFIASFLVDLIPVIGPPAWIAMVFLLVKFDLNPWIVLAVGVPGSVLGRHVMSVFIVPRMSKRFLKTRKRSELEFLGRKMSQTLWRSWSFILAYSLLPLSTTALFTAAGIAKIPALHTLPPFFVGKFASDALMLFVAGYATKNWDEIVESAMSWKTIVGTVGGLVILGALLFIDWKQLLMKRRLVLNFHVFT